MTKFGNTTEEERNKLKRNLAREQDVALGINNRIMCITASQMYFSILEYTLSEQDCMLLATRPLEGTDSSLRNTKMDSSSQQSTYGMEELLVSRSKEQNASQP